MKTAAEILIEHGIDLKSSAPGRYYTTCPQCSAVRSKPHRGNKVLGITINSAGVQWGCNHCAWTGGGYYNGKANGHAHSDFVATYDYFDESGTLLFQVCRRADKSFTQRRPDGKGGWAWGTKDVRKVLYRLPETIEAIAAGHTILICEGEKDANVAWRIGLPATCNPGGANEHVEKSKWRKEFSESLRGADVVIIPDHDGPGYAHAKSIANSLAGIAKRVRVLKLADHWREVAAKKGGDLSDGLAAGHTRENRRGAAGAVGVEHSLAEAQAEPQHSDAMCRFVSRRLSAGVGSRRPLEPHGHHHNPRGSRRRMSPNARSGAGCDVALPREKGGSPWRSSKRTRESSIGVKTGRRASLRRGTGDGVCAILGGTGRERGVSGCLLITHLAAGDRGSRPAARPTAWWPLARLRLASRPLTGHRRKAQGRRAAQARPFRLATDGAPWPLRP